MSPLKRKALALVLLGWSLASHHVHAATAQPMAIEAEDRAKLARVKAKGNASAKPSFKPGSGGEQTDCKIDIGNVDTGGRVGRGPREVNIFVTGDIFQVNNRCR